MDLIHEGNDAVYDGYPGMGLIRAYEKLRFWLQSNTQDAGDARTSSITTISATTSTGCGWTTR